MTPTLPDWLRPLWPAILSGVTTTVAAYLVKRGFAVSPDDLVPLAGAMLTGSLVLSKLIARRVNPTNSADPKLARQGTQKPSELSRERLGERLEAAATTPLPDERVSADVITAPRRREDDVERRAGWMGRPPEMRPEAEPTARPAFEPLMMSGALEGNASTDAQEFGDSFAPPAPRPKRKRAARVVSVTPPEPGAPQPETVVEQPIADFEP